MAEPTVRFALSGFVEKGQVRTFRFDCIAKDWSRTGATVTIDLLLAHKFNIRLQELPLLCLHLLEIRYKGPEGDSAFDYTEAEMRSRSVSITAAADAARKQRKKTVRPPTTSQTGMAWRGMASKGA